MGMKKGVVLLIGFILLFSIVLVLAQNESDDESDDEQEDADN